MVCSCWSIPQKRPCPTTIYRNWTKNLTTHFRGFVNNLWPCNARQEEGGVNLGSWLPELAPTHHQPSSIHAHTERAPNENKCAMVWIWNAFCRCTHGVASNLVHSTSTMHKAQNVTIIRVRFRGVPLTKAALSAGSVRNVASSVVVVIWISGLPKCVCVCTLDWDNAQTTRSDDPVFLGHGHVPPWAWQ